MYWSVLLPLGYATLPHLTSPYKGEEQDGPSCGQSLHSVNELVNIYNPERSACPESFEGKDLVVILCSCRGRISCGPRSFLPWAPMVLDPFAETKGISPCGGDTPHSSLSPCGGETPQALFS